MNKIYIIIVSYNGMLWLKKCLDSCTDYNVIIVDNNSADNTIDFVEKNFPKVKLFKQNKNLGFGQANNIGISYALSKGAKHIFLLNQDAYIIDDCLEKLIEYQTAHPEYAILSPVHVNATQDKLDKNFAEYVSYKFNKNFYSDFVLKLNLKPVYSVPFVNAAAWLISREIIEVVGGFDPLFYHYGEDDNYCQRALFHDFKIGIIPTAYIVHDREFREQTISETTSEILKKKEIVLKSQWANINIDSHKAITAYKRNLILHFLKSIFKLSFKKSIYYAKELILINKIKPEIFKSKNTYKKKGSHFISIN